MASWVFLGEVSQEGRRTERGRAQFVWELPVGPGQGPEDAEGACSVPTSLSAVGDLRERDTARIRGRWGQLCPPTVGAKALAMRSAGSPCHCALISPEPHLARTERGSVIQLCGTLWPGRQRFLQALWVRQAGRESGSGNLGHSLTGRAHPSLRSQPGSGAQRER